jgi:diaminopimelate decarboxylase
MTEHRNHLLNRIGKVLDDKPAEVPADAIHHMVRQCLDRRDLLEGKVKEHGSPLYVIDTARLRDNAARFSRVMTENMPCPIRIYYAVKSNNHPAVAGTFLDAGLGLDVSGGPELKMALSLQATDIVFSGPGKTDEELVLACDHADNVTVLLDSFSELARLERIAWREGRIIRAGVRLTTMPRGLWRKFGIPLERLAEFIAATRKCPHIDLRGLQFHTSWNLTPANQVDFMRRLGHAIDELPPSGKDMLRFIDIGGGYWPEEGEWLHSQAVPAGAIKQLAGDHIDNHARYHMPADPLEQFAAQLGAAVGEHLLRDHDLTVCFEPGRWLCHNSMDIVMSVVDRKEDDLVITDAGTNAIGWERLESDFFPVVNLTRPSMTETRCDILGCLCTPHDVWGYSYWGDGIEAGDVLVVPSQGAYTYSLRQNFIKDLPKEVTLQSEGRVDQGTH